MKRTILGKIALALGVFTVALAGVGQAQAQGSTSSLSVMTRCESNGIKVAGTHGMSESMVSGNPARVFFATYLMKYLPPNWVFTSRAITSWSSAAHQSALNTPVARDLIDLVPSHRFGITEPGTYFVYVLFAYPNGNGGYSYLWKTSNVCTIHGSVMSRPSGAQASKVKKAKKAVKAAPRPTKPPFAIG